MGRAQVTTRMGKGRDLQVEETVTCSWLARRLLVFSNGVSMVQLNFRHKKSGAPSEDLGALFAVDQNQLDRELAPSERQTSASWAWTQSRGIT